MNWSRVCFINMALLLFLSATIGNVAPASAGDKEDVITKLGEGKAKREAAGKMTKPEQAAEKKKALNAAIAAWQAAYLIAKKFDAAAAEAIKEEEATDQRALGEPAKAGAIEEQTAEAISKLADAAAKANDPKRAQELYAKAEQKWRRAAADNPAQAPVDTGKADAAAKSAQEMGARVAAATPPAGHP